ncbi:thiamine-phosphate synthase family protein [Acidianus sulfidivorans]|uniref:thiamine-phosphate synthase family protein n=1 Tax=Acidianus sulfidivorans TaxID=312539 RepID=UPI00197BECA1|nr:thiamine-phosphate synthase family protein [Acidianus sulfidivorans]
MLDTPLSLITDILLPNIRALEAKRLRNLGLSQSKIATVIGVTQPAVKQYLDINERFYLEKLHELGLTEDEINYILDMITEILLSNNIESSMQFITTIGLSYLSQLKFCNFHRSQDSRIPQDCRICETIYKQDEEEQLELSIAMLQNSLVSPLIPEVLSNIAYSKKNPKTIEDIIAIAGRITKIRDIPTPASKPMWGASKHLGRILLGISKKFPEIRSVMNIKYDEKIRKILDELKMKYKITGPTDYADDEIIENLVISNYSELLDAIVHLGGKGVEPITYIFGRDPLEVAKKIIMIGKIYNENGK